MVYSVHEFLWMSRGSEWLSPEQANSGLRNRSLELLQGAHYFKYIAPRYAWTGARRMMSNSRHRRAVGDFRWCCRNNPELAVSARASNLRGSGTFRQWSSFDRNLEPAQRASDWFVSVRRPSANTTNFNFGLPDSHFVPVLRGYSVAETFMPSHYTSGKKAPAPPFAEQIPIASKINPIPQLDMPVLAPAQRHQCRQGPGAKGYSALGYDSSPSLIFNPCMTRHQWI